MYITHACTSTCVDHLKGYGLLGNCLGINDVMYGITVQRILKFILYMDMLQLTITLLILNFKASLTG